MPFLTYQFERKSGIWFGRNLNFLKLYLIVLAKVQPAFRPLF